MNQNFKTQILILIHYKFLESFCWRNRDIGCLNGLQVNRGGVFDREFTKSLIIRDFDDVLKNPFRYVHLSYYTHYYQNKIPKIAMHDL